MSSEQEDNAPISRERRDAVREKAQQVHVQQSRARVLRRSALVAGMVAAVAVVAVVVTWAVAGSLSKPQLAPENTTGDGFAVTAVTGAAQVRNAPDGSATPAAEDPAATPPAAEETAAATGQVRPPVEIHVYVDYLSTGAREWQLANAKQLSSWVDDGAATLTYHPVSMLTAKSNGTKYSLRAAGAAACMATYAPEKFFAFNSELLSKQPTVDSDGLSDADLVSLAIATGGDPKQVRPCIEEHVFSSWVKGATERAVAGIPDTDGIALAGTSLILVNGEEYVGDLADPAEFSQFVLTSASGAMKKAESATPTPTPTTAP